MVFVEFHNINATLKVKKFINISIVKQTIKITIISFITNLVLKVPLSISVFFMSIIGPNIRKAIKDPVVNCPTNVLATNASVSKHTANKNTKPIIRRMEYILCWSTNKTYFLGMNVCISADKNDPIIPKPPRIITTKILFEKA